MTTNNQHIIDLCNQLTAALREDIRQDLIRKIRGEFGMGVATDMHGMPVNAPTAAVRRKMPRAGSKLNKLYRALVRRSYGVNRDTLVRETGMTPMSLAKAISELRAIGKLGDRKFSIVCERRGRKPKYRLVA